MVKWIIGIHIALTLACWGYARFLNQRWVYEWYHPDRTWVTVVGGDAIIGCAIGGLCILGIFPWLLLLLYATLHVAAGVPIIVWQFQRETQRRRQIEEIERGA